MGGSVGNPAGKGKKAEPDQPKRPRSLRRSCTPCRIKALVRPPRAPWEGAPGGPPKPEQDNEEGYGKASFRGAQEKGVMTFDMMEGPV